MLTRRGVITGLISLVASPAIVRAASLMPVKAMLPEELLLLRIADAEQVTLQLLRHAVLPSMTGPDWREITRMTRDAFMPRLHRETWRVRGWEVSL